MSWSGPSVRQELAIEKGRVSLVSWFSGSLKRESTEMVKEQTRFVATVVDRGCYIETTPGGAVESLANWVREGGKLMDF